MVINTLTILSQNIQKKIRHKNQWVKKHIPNALQNYDTLHRWKVNDSKLSKIFKSFFEKVWNKSYGDLMEKQAREIQQTKMKMFKQKHLLYILL